MDTPRVGGLERIDRRWEDTHHSPGNFLHDSGTPPHVKSTTAFLSLSVVPRGDAGGGWNDGQVRLFIGLVDLGGKLPHPENVKELKLMYLNSQHSY